MNSALKRVTVSAEARSVGIAVAVGARVVGRAAGSGTKMGHGEILMRRLKGE